MQNILLQENTMISDSDRKWANSWATHSVRDSLGVLYEYDSKPTLNQNGWCHGGEGSVVVSQRSVSSNWRDSLVVRNPTQSTLPAYVFFNDWAMFAAINKNGRLFEFEHKPVAVLRHWHTTTLPPSRTAFIRNTSTDNWQASLIERSGPLPGSEPKWLPKVDEEFEMNIQSEWISCKVIMYDNIHAWVKDLKRSQYRTDAIDYWNIRPLKSKKELTIDSVMQEYSVHTEAAMHNTAIVAEVKIAFGIAYDAGLLKEINNETE